VESATENLGWRRKEINMNFDSTIPIINILQSLENINSLSKRKVKSEEYTPWWWKE